MIPDAHRISGKAEIQKAIQDATNQLLHRNVRQNPAELYLTREQYERDPAGWKAVLRQYGLPGDSIVIVPETI